MPIYQIRHERNFFSLSNAVVNDTRISFKAKGILAYLLSKPDDWKVYQNDIVKQSTDGEFSVRKGIMELIDAGYIVRRSIRDEKGRITEWEYTVSECPDCGFQRVDNPDVDNSTLLNTDGTKNVSNQKRNNDKGLIPAESNLPSHDSVSLGFYDWYVAKCYPHYKKKAHPRLKKAQRETVLTSLDSFISENCVDLECLGVMANKYLRTVKGCDHNINHFATDGIMMNRYYEELY